VTVQPRACKACAIQAPKTPAPITVAAGTL
jgi:hypothetical protein